MVDRRRTFVSVHTRVQFMEDTFDIVKLIQRQVDPSKAVNCSEL
ncbi:MAG: hypothetical protein O2930_04530 [Acidobacteria bacterium]|nr:hypothetical protein [Acidobacteriota bacterium]